MYIIITIIEVLEKAMAPHSSTLAWKTHGWRSLVGCSPWGHEESDTTERLHFHFSLSCIGEGNGNPLQCSCLENPRDGRAWWALSTGSHRVGHDWSDLAAAAAAVCVCHYLILKWTVINRKLKQKLISLIEVVAATGKTPCMKMQVQKVKARKIAQFF